MADVVLDPKFQAMFDKIEHMQEQKTKYDTDIQVLTMEHSINKTFNDALKKAASQVSRMSSQ